MAAPPLRRCGFTRVNAADNMGSTAMMRAARAGHTAVVEALAGHGADVNAADNNGSTAMRCAAGAGHTAVVEALAGRGLSRSTLPDIRQGVHNAASFRQRPVLEHRELQSHRGLVYSETVGGGQQPSVRTRTLGFASLLGEEWVTDSVMNSVFLLICNQQGWGYGAEPPAEGGSIWVAPIEMLQTWGARSRAGAWDWQWDFNRNIDGGATGEWGKRFRIPSSLNKQSLKAAAHRARYLFIPMNEKGVHYLFASIDLVDGQISLHNSFGITRPEREAGARETQRWADTCTLIAQLQSWAKHVQKVLGITVTPFEVRIISSRTQFDGTSCALHIFGNIIAEATGCTTRRCTDALHQPLRCWIGLALWLAGSLPARKQDLGFQQWPTVFQEAVATTGHEVSPRPNSIDCIWPELWQGLMNLLATESLTREVCSWQLHPQHEGTEDGPAKARFESPAASSRAAKESPPMTGANPLHRTCETAGKQPLKETLQLHGTRPWPPQNHVRPQQQLTPTAYESNSCSLEGGRSRGG